ncbi:putative transcription factor interactor and regulator CCHC(Zn) family [Helianthus annuus]|nr:putative transcription factor interactor and regulator CCHC(Zn) family [Helianthus annuus]
MMAEVAEITETDAEPEVVVSEDVDGKAADIADSDSEVVEETVTENVESVPEIGIEEVIEGVDQEFPESVSDDLSFESRREEFIYTMKSILPPNVFGSFADFFEDPRTGTCPRFEAKKDEVVEIIDVSKEMTEEALKDIADKALMSKLKEVDSDIPESVDKMSGLGETGVVEVSEVKVSESESTPVGNMVCENESLGEKVSIPDTPCQSCSQPCTECLVKDTMYQELKQHADLMKFDLGQVKEAYDTLSRSIKMIQKESLENDKATKLAQSTLFDKQREVNFHLDTIASLRKELELTKIENDRIDQKLMSYVASSYVLEQIVPQQPYATPAFNSVPPPMWNHYTQKYPDGVEAALNIKLKTLENDLPDNLDITFNASDIDNSSQVIKNVIVQVLDNDSEKSEQAKSVESGSESEEDGNFLDRYLTKMDKSTDDDSIMVAYTMVGSDKLYSNTEFPLQSVRFETVQKVFKLVELNVNELKKNDFFAKLNKSVGSSCSTSQEKVEGVGKGKNINNKLKKKGIGFEKRMAKQVVKPKERIDDVFVCGPSTEIEKDYILSQKAVEDFNAAQKLKAETVSSTFVEYDKRLCYRCNEVGHMAKQCKKVFEKPVVVKTVAKKVVEKPKVEKPKVENNKFSKQNIQKPRPKTPVVAKDKQVMVLPIRILKRGERLKSEDKPKSTFEIGESSKSPKTSTIYFKEKTFEKQSWIAKPKPSNEIKKMETELKNESQCVRDDVGKCEFELDKFMSEFPKLHNRVKQDKKEVESNVTFSFPKTTEKCDVVFGTVSEELPKSVLSRWIMDSGASRHMTGSLALLYDVKAINGSYVGFAGNQGGRIVGQGMLTNDIISFDKVNYIVELTNNLLSISQICDKDFSVHFTKTECLVLKPGFKVPDELVLLRAPRVNDLYILDMSAATPTTPQKQCFVTKAKATEKESVMWHRKMGHIHIRKMNFLVHNDLVEGVNVKNFIYLTIVLLVRKENRYENLIRQSCSTPSGYLSRDCIWISLGRST